MSGMVDSILQRGLYMWLRKTAKKIPLAQGLSK